jgi:integrase
MATTLYPKRKHLTVIEKGANVYFRVQINKLKLGLKVNKTFSDYGQAVEFLEACLNKLASKHVKTMLEIESNEMKIISDFMQHPPLSEYLKEYVRTYINPKYEHLTTANDKDKYKLRQRDGLIKTLKRILDTEINHKDQNDWALNELVLTARTPTKLGDLKPSQITIDDANQLILALKRQGLKPISVSDYLSRMSVFWKKLKYMDRKLEDATNPFLNYDKDLINHGQKRFQKKAFRFTTEKLRAVAAVIKRNGNPEFKAIIHLMYKLGLRRQEAVLLEKNQISVSPRPHIYIESKNHERIVYLNERTLRLLKPFIKPSQERLFSYKVLGFDGSFVKPFRPHGIDQHSFRKDYISRMIEQIGVSNSILLSQLLGFATPRAIERLEATFPEAQALTQQQLLKQIGHKSSRITAEHYFSFK